MQITELARRAGVKVSTIRFYERSGVLAEPKRTSNGYRAYDGDDAVFVRFLRRGQELGFTLAELSAFVELSARARSGVASADEVAQAAVSKVAEIEDRIAALERTRAAITGMIDAQCVDADAPCPIVQALGTEPAAVPRRDR